MKVKLLLITLVLAFVGVVSVSAEDDAPVCSDWQEHFIIENSFHCDGIGTYKLDRCIGMKYSEMYGWYKTIMAYRATCVYPDEEVPSTVTFIQSLPIIGNHNAIIGEPIWR